MTIDRPIWYEWLDWDKEDEELWVPLIREDAPKEIKKAYEEHREGLRKKLRK